MAKMKVYELAKEIDKPSKDIINYLKNQGVDVKSHMSNIDDASVNMVKKNFSPQERAAARPAAVQTAPRQENAGSRPIQNRPAPSDRQASSDRQAARPGSGTGFSRQNPGSAQGQRPQGQNTQNRPFNAQNNRPGNRYSGGQQGQRPGSDNSQNRSAGNASGQYRQPGQNRPMNGQNAAGAGQGGYGRPYNQQQGQYRQNNTGTGANANTHAGGHTPQNRTGSYGYGNPRQGSDSGNSGRMNQGGMNAGRNYQGSNNGRPNPNTGNTGRGYQSGTNAGRGYQSGGNTGRPQNYSSQGNRPGQSGSYNGQNRSGQQGGGTGQGNSYPNRNYGSGNSGNYRNNDSRPTDAKKVDAPLGMSRSDSVNNRNSRVNKNSKNNNRNNNYNHRNIDEDTVDVIKTNPNRKGQFIQPKPVQKQAVEDEIKSIIIPEVLTIKELADKMKKPASAIVKKLFLAGKMVSINQEITFEEAEEIAIEYDIIAELEEKVNVIEELLKEDEEDPATLVKRPPVVCVMGHVDHGKTSLLDAIRETHVTSHEAGGITQHIGAYVVDIKGEKITFLDTPGHEAFTSMRMRGAQSTDIAILVVAADDGVMPQTVEAISHAKAAGIQIIVAINKIDKPSANIERVKQELTEYGLVAEDWGGDTVFVPVSAHTKEGITQLLEMILLTSEVAELKANPNRNARGVVIEAELDKGRGPVATILVQKGILHVGDSIVIGASFGKVRAMMDDKGRRVKEAGPSTPVEILGLNEVPDAGEVFMATDNEKEARSISETYITQGKEKLLADTKAKLSLDGLFSQIKAGNIKELNIIVKADVQGSVEAVKQSLQKLSNSEVAVRTIHGGVGAINESDVILASASNAIIIGFNVRPDNAAKETAEREKVDVRLYRVIYNAIEDVEAAMKGMLDPVFEEKVIGHAEVRQVFKASGLGTIAGSYVLDGKITRGCSARISRDGSVIFDGALASLKRFKDDVKEVAAGYECGLVFEKFNDIKEQDTVELYVMQEVPR